MSIEQPTKELLTCIAVLSLTGCDYGAQVCEQYAITELGDCTNSTADAWNGRREGKCRAVLENGQRLDVTRPVMVGDTVKFCRYDGPGGFEMNPEVVDGR